MIGGRTSMIVLLAGVCVAGCDGGEKTAHPKAAATKSVPAGPYAVRYECFQSNQPWSKGWLRQTYITDLAARTRSTLLEESKGDDDLSPPELDAGVRAAPVPTVAPLKDDRVAPIEAAIVKVLRGGPYKDESPVPEGISCMLSIQAGGKKVFEIDKSRQEIKDDVSALLQELSR